MSTPKTLPTQAPDLGTTLRGPVGVPLLSPFEQALLAALERILIKPALDRKAA
jgi:hypothetical protein